MLTSEYLVSNRDRIPLIIPNFMLFAAFMCVNVPCCMYFRKIVDVSIFLHSFSFFLFNLEKR